MAGGENKDNSRAGKSRGSATPPAGHVPLPVLLLELRRDSRSSVVSTGRLPPVLERIYVPDSVDAEVMEWLHDPTSRLLVLTGSAGHGKSAAIARARKEAEKLGLPLRIRFDATHAEQADQGYRVALREFLQPFANGQSPQEKHIIAMNLGLALDFFGGRDDDAKRFQAVGAAFEAKFALGLAADSPAHPTVRIIDLRNRMRLSFDENRLRATVPFIEQLFGRFSIHEDTPAGDSVRDECTMCPKQAVCPVLMNARLLSEPNVRSSLTHALMAGAIERGLHLTPRSILDVIARVTIPKDLEGEIDTSSTECSLRVGGGPLMATIAEDSGWGKRLHLTLFDLAFPSLESNCGDDLEILLSLALEDPGQIRAESWDKDILRWMADPHELYRALPPVVLGYLGLKDAKFLGLKGLPLAIRSIAWTRGISQGALMDHFVGLCCGNASAQESWSGPIREALVRIAARRFDDQPLGDTTKLALNLEGVASRVRLLADLFLGRVQFDGAGPVSLNDAHFRISIPASGGAQALESFSIDWARFQLLSQVAQGYQPSSKPGPHQFFLAEVARRLAGASMMKEVLIAHIAGNEGEENVPVKLAVHKAAGRLRIKAEVHNDQRA